MVVLLLRRAARRGRWCPWDGASATFSTPGSVLSSRSCFWPSLPWARTPAAHRTPRLRRGQGAFHLGDHAPRRRVGADRRLGARAERCL